MRGPNNKGCAKIGVVVYSKRNYKELGWGKYDISFDYKVSLDDNSISDFHILEDAHLKKGQIVLAVFDKEYGDASIIEQLIGIDKVPYFTKEDFNRYSDVSNIYNGNEEFNTNIFIYNAFSLSYSINGKTYNFSRKEEKLFDFYRFRLKYKDALGIVYKYDVPFVSEPFVRTCHDGVLGGYTKKALVKWKSKSNLFRDIDVEFANLISEKKEELTAKVESLDIENIINSFDIKYEIKCVREKIGGDNTYETSTWSIMDYEDCYLRSLFSHELCNSYSRESYYGIPSYSDIKREINSIKPELIKQALLEYDKNKHINTLFCEWLESYLLPKSSLCEIIKFYEVQINYGNLKLSIEEDWGISYTIKIY